MDVFPEPFYTVGLVARSMRGGILTYLLAVLRLCRTSGYHRWSDIRMVHACHILRESLASKHAMEAYGSANESASGYHGHSAAGEL